MNNPQIDVPDSLAELFKSPQRVSDALKLLNALLNVRIVLAQPVAAGNASKLVATIDNAVLTLALRYPTMPDAAPAYAGGAANATYLQSEITALKNQVAALTTLANAIRAGEYATQYPASQ